MLRRRYRALSKCRDYRQKEREIERANEREGKRENVRKTVRQRDSETEGMETEGDCEKEIKRC